MTDEDIAKLTSSELIDLIKRLLDEIEIRLMQLVKRANLTKYYD